ncbi:MAG: cupin domain-containing protein [Halobacteriales archaeon]|nr:cupin domain-containing protein [Halobacteriales archaeon]
MVNDPVNEADCEWIEVERGATHFRRKRLGAAAGSDALGCSLYELPPGARSWPYHFHTGNEEAIYVLAGTGELRTPDGMVPLAAGDYVALPADAEGAHRVHNPDDDQDDTPLRYLMTSTMNDPDVTVYPDSEKVSVFAGAPPGGDGERVLDETFRRADEVSYWEGEE